MDQIEDIGVKNVGVAPRAQAPWRVGPRVKSRLIQERAQVEGKIGTIKSYRFNQSKAKTNTGVQRSAFRAALCFNLKKLHRDFKQLGDHLQVPQVA